MIAIYHRVYRRENFEKAAKDLVGLIYAAQIQNPNIPRSVYVDIDGHRNDAGEYDVDMLELQMEFGMGFLLQFVEELHFPLVAVKNPNRQRNDVPQKIVIGNERNERDSSLEELYIENYSNTEFMSEDDVYQYMKKVSEFMKRYNEWTFYSVENRDYNSFSWLRMWRRHINELANELFNSFIFGNLISVAAMTRALIECYVYVSILQKEESEELIDEWWLCNIIHKIRDGRISEDKQLVDMVKAYCERRGLNFDEKWKYYMKESQRENGWLRKLMGDNGVGFRALCEYIGEGDVHKDYQSASAFVHAQDVENKLSPFTFYSSIYNRLFLMLHYIFKTIQLFELSEAEKAEVLDLKEELLKLGEKYLNYKDCVCENM